MREMHKRVMVWFWVLVGTWAFSGVASAAPNGDKTRAFRYQLRALGTYAGEGVLTIGAKEDIGGRPLRPIRIEAFTAGMASGFLSAKTFATTWVNGSWLPVRSRWDMEINQEKRILKASYDRQGVKGSLERAGKARDFNHKTKGHGLELVSVFTWMMNADLSPGKEYSMPVFDSRFIYQVDAKVGVSEEIQVPVGFRQAIPVQIRVTRGKYQRDATLYLSADRDRTPLKLVFKYGMIGTVEASLVGEKQV